MTLIVIDPGHGGDDEGASAGGVIEADIVLDYAQQIADFLRLSPVVATLTRDGPYTLKLGSRAKFANATNANCFVSVHANWSSNPQAHGFQVFHCKGSFAGEMLADSIFDSVAQEFPQNNAWAGVFPDESRMCGERRLYVLRATRMPAVLIELGFLTNPNERDELIAADYRRNLSEAIARGILAFVHMPRAA